MFAGPPRVRGADGSACGPPRPARGHTGRGGRRHRAAARSTIRSMTSGSGVSRGTGRPKAFQQARARWAIQPSARADGQDSRARPRRALDGPPVHLQQEQAFAPLPDPIADGTSGVPIDERLAARHGHVDQAPAAAIADAGPGLVLGQVGVNLADRRPIGRRRRAGPGRLRGAGAVRRGEAPQSRECGRRFPSQSDGRRERKAGAAGTADSPDRPTEPERWLPAGRRHGPGGDARGRVATPAMPAAGTGTPPTCRRAGTTVRQETMPDSRQRQNTFVGEVVVGVGVEDGPGRVRVRSKAAQRVSRTASASPGRAARISGVTGQGHWLRNWYESASRCSRSGGSLI